MAHVKVFLSIRYKAPVSLYLFLNLATLVFPFLASFDRRIAYARTWLALFPAILLTGLFFVAWDMCFTSMGIWGFNPIHLLGPSYWGLPLEEWLFFLCIPFANVFIYASLRYFIPRPRLSQAVAERMCIGLGTGLLVLSLAHTELTYTFYNSLFTGIWLLVQGLWWKGRYLPHFFIAYAWHLIPFFIVNGLLTGFATEEPVVWYDNTENLSLRILTIPVEDFFYSMLLFLMTLNCYEFMKRCLSLDKK